MTFLSALILGLLASAHCGAMCSGVQQALQPNHVIRSQQRLVWHNFGLNFGRVTTYIWMGAFLGLGGVSLITFVGAQHLIQPFRIATAIVLMLIGLQLIFKNHPILSILEPIGNLVWKRVSKLRPPADEDSILRSFRSGVIWGLLPCGLLYSVLLTASLSGSAINASLIMLGFGLGTLPALYLTGTAWMTFKNCFHTHTAQRAAGSFYCFGGVMILCAPILIDMKVIQTYPGLVNLLFCAQ